ncbi:hypothetical protein PIB30_061263 [Stylosanthes scabra]|uniref:Uncharacterized protein n=1 Tax=Stylosanthes scabra TaxID=79078 RepID=A0ABU6RL37_9FABA|nr:hypothetical protein [Stylosanthes scabra]
MEGRLKFEEAKREMKIDTDSFEVNSSFVEPCYFGVNMAGFTSFEFDTSLGNFEENIRQVFPRVGEALFEKERMKKELAHKGEQVRQRQGARRTESSNVMVVPPIQMQWVGGSSGVRFPGYNDFPGHRNFRGGNRVSPFENKDKGAKTTTLHRVVFPKTQGKVKEIAADPKVDSKFMKEEEGDDLYDDEFVEEDEMISVVSILPDEFADSSRECLDGDYYDPAQGEDFLWVRNEREASSLDQLKRKRRT